MLYKVDKYHDFAFIRTVIQMFNKLLQEFGS